MVSRARMRVDHTATRRQLASDETSAPHPFMARAVKPRYATGPGTSNGSIRPYHCHWQLISGVRGGDTGQSSWDRCHRVVDQPVNAEPLAKRSKGIPSCRSAPCLRQLFKTYAMTLRA